MNKNIFNLVLYLLYLKIVKISLLLTNCNYINL